MDMSYIPKFRVWDRKNHAMLYPNISEYNNYGDTDKYTRMMCLNIKDKNGIDIYEFDSVKVYHPSRKSENIRDIKNGLVVWNKEFAGWGYLSHGFVYDFFYYDDTIEIIDNIEMRFKRGELVE